MKYLVTPKQIIDYVSAFLLVAAAVVKCCTISASSDKSS